MKVSLVNQCESLFILPTVVVCWEWNLVTISFTWLKWSIDIDFEK